MTLVAKSVIVFGGSGFLGSYLVSELLEKRYRVVVADVQKSAFNPKAIFEKCDILDTAQIKNVFERHEIEYVYNLAGFANMEDASSNPVDSITLNVIGNLNILEGAKRKKVKRYLYASSAYAMSEKGSFYGISKLCSEKIIEEYQSKYALDFTIIRFGSVYSERPFHNNYIFNLVKQAVREKRIVHPGDGEELREYIHAADAAKLSVQLLSDNNFVNEHVILTGVEPIKRKQLFQMIKEILGDDLEIVLGASGYKDHYKLTPYSFHPTISKKFVANPFIDLGQGILECIRSVHSEQAYE
jgi:UDP-glucose 4-epimerase